MEDCPAIGAMLRRKLRGSVFETLPISPTEKAAKSTDLNFRPPIVIYFLTSETETDIQEA